MKPFFILGAIIMLLYLLSIPISGDQLGIGVTLAFFASPLMPRAEAYNIVLAIYIMIMVALFILGFWLGGDEE